MQKIIEHVVRNCPERMIHAVASAEVSETKCRYCDHHSHIVGDLFDCLYESIKSDIKRINPLRGE